jgi:adenine-specific DNA methylase
MSTQTDRPSTALLACIDWPSVDARVRVQQRSRERHTPPISLYRWWARRPHALIGALLDAAGDLQGEEQAPVVADPFSGGGTVALESVLRGYPTFAQDLHPWAMTGLATALDGVSAGQLTEATHGLLAALEPIRRELYGTCCPDHGPQSEVLVTFWARVVECPGCDRAIHLFPYSMLTRSSRIADEPMAWWGCRRCGCVAERPLDGPGCCPSCRHVYEHVDERLMPDRQARCPHRSCRTFFDVFSRDPTPQVALVQRLCTVAGSTVQHFARPTTHERELARRGARGIPDALKGKIPAGQETRVLHRTGFSRWMDLYPRRQLRVMLAALRAVDHATDDPAVATRLRLAISGAGEMAGFASRWDRFYPKAFEALANHRYGITGFSCEVNLLADRGRGTLPRRMKATVAAAKWMTDRQMGKPPVSPQLLPATARRRSSRSPAAYLTVGSSRRQLAGDGSVDLVLTDPPYYDDVQYGELAALFLAWAQAAGIVSDSVELDLGSEAVINVARGTDTERYRQLLTDIFKESHRALKPEGRLVITFHNTDVRAWWALGRALHGASFDIRSLAVAEAENGTDHPKRGRMGFTHDLVIECHRKTGASPSSPLVATRSEEAQSLELIAAGRAMAAPGSQGELADFQQQFERFRAGISPLRIGRARREVQR